MLRRYLLKRLVVAIPSLIIASLIVFTLPRLLPGDAVQLTDQPGSIASFGEDANGEIYVCSLSGNTVYRIDPA